MNTPHFFHQSSLSIGRWPSSNAFKIIFVLLLINILGACKGTLSDHSDKTTNARRLRIKVGQVKEIKLSSPKDSTLLVVGSTDNEEIVDVSRREVGYELNDATKSEPTGSAIFLIKGVTNGNAKVVFAEKKVDEEGPGRILKTYMVEVITK
jgi:hypothetical protein